MSNVKAGELAIHVNAAYRQNIGKVVEVLHSVGYLRAGTRFMASDGRWRHVDRDGFFWWTRCEGGLTTNLGVIKENHALDAHLRPIRDPGDDAVDESLQWLPTPSNSTAKEEA